MKKISFFCGAGISRNSGIPVVNDTYKHLSDLLTNNKYDAKTLFDWRGKPDAIRSDNGSEFISTAISEWSNLKDIKWNYIQLGKPTQNSLIERFNRTFRQDVLENYMFESLSELRKYAQTWAGMYSNERPHAALGYLTPVEFVLKYGKLPAKQQGN